MIDIKPFTPPRRGVIVNGEAITLNDNTDWRQQPRYDLIEADERGISVIEGYRNWGILAAPAPELADNQAEVVVHYGACFVVEACIRRPYEIHWRAPGAQHQAEWR